MVGEQEHVVIALGERRQAYRRDVQPEIEIFAESFGVDGAAQIFVGGGQDAHIHVDGLRAADAIETFFLEHTQQFRLRGHRQFGDFVQENRTAVRQLHFADFARARAGVGAALVAEQFVFHQAFGNCRAIESDEGKIAPRRKVMDGAGEKFLARAAIAEQQHGGIGGGHALRLQRRVAHGRGFANDARESVARGVILAQQQILAQHFLLARRAFDEQLQMFQIDGLLDEIERAVLHRRHGLFDGTKRGDQNHGNGRIGLLRFAQDVQARFSGQLEVGEHEQVAARADFLHRA